MGSLLNGRAAVVAGSSRGIGRAVARALAAEGASVVVNGRDADATRTVAGEIEAQGGRARAVPGSVADFACAGAVVDECVARFGGIDVLVNCAGIAEPAGSSILDAAPEDWQALLDTHLTATFNTCRHAAPHFVERGSGSIVNTGSHAFLGVYGGTGYPAGKGGTNALTAAIAAELREHGVRANTVCPGARTRLSTGPDYEARVRELHARGLLSDVARDASLSPPAPEHVAALYLYLASDLSAGITGRIFSGSGGYVGLFEREHETLVAFRDAEREGAWQPAELDVRVRASKAL